VCRAVSAVRPGRCRCSRAGRARRDAACGARVRRRMAWRGTAVHIALARDDRAPRPRELEAVCWMDTVSAREGLRGDHGVRNVRGTSTAEGEGVTSRTAVVFALPPGVTVTHVEVDGVDATAEAVGEGAWSVGAPGSRQPPPRPGAVSGTLGQGLHARRGGPPSRHRASAAIRSSPGSAPTPARSRPCAAQTPPTTPPAPPRARSRGSAPARRCSPTKTAHSSGLRTRSRPIPAPSAARR
jgi:hypothetical protein